MKSTLTKALVAVTAISFSTLAYAAKDFTAADSDGNGKVTWEEAAAANPEMTQEAFKALDKDGDGTLSAEEYNAAG